MKNLLLFSTILLTSTVAFAQLTVKPNGTADSYVYVKDQVLFVTSDINLTRNGVANNQEASIYLRDNAQLIQSGTTSSNTGNGLLSAQQNTTETNRWGYYLWCSPVGNPTIAPTTGNTNFGIGSVYQPTGVTAANLALRTTGPDGILNPFTVSTRWLYTFEIPGTELESNYKRMNAGNNAPPGFGYTMKGVGINLPGDDFNYDFRGRPNTGEFTIPVGPSLMTLSGNPYPSALDLNKLFYDLPENAALGTFWYYDEDRSEGSHNYSGKPFGYGVYTVGPQDTDNDPYNGNNLGSYVAAPFDIYTSQGGGTGTGTGSGGNDQNKRFAPIGQGIMFVGDAVGTVKIKNAYRVFFKENTPGSVFQRPDTNQEIENTAGKGPILIQGIEAIEVIEDNRMAGMRVWATFDRAITRDMLLNFSDQATDGYDRGFDGLSAQDLKTDAYFPVVGINNTTMPYVINAINFEPTKLVPFGLKIKNQTRVDIRIVEEIKTPYKSAYIFDRLENTYQEIIGGQVATLNLPAGKYENRFFIVFQNPNIKKDAPIAEIDAKTEVMEKVTFFQNNPAQQLEVLNPDGYTLKSATVYDMNGKLIINEKNLGDNTKYSFYTGNLSDGVYIVKLITSEDITIDYRAIVHNK